MPGRLQYEPLEEVEPDVEARRAATADDEAPSSQAVPATRSSSLRAPGGIFLLLSSALALVVGLDVHYHQRRRGASLHAAPWPQLSVQSSAQGPLQLDALTPVVAPWPAAPAVPATLTTVTDAFASAPPEASAAPPNPFEVGDKVGLSPEDAHKTVSGAFNSLDGNNDGVLDAQKHGMLAPMTEEQFDERVAEEAEAFVMAEEAVNPEMSAAIQRMKLLQAEAVAENAENATNSTKEAMKLDVGNMDKRLVDYVYTFGAPSTGKSPVYDSTREGGCFSGLRVYSETLKYSPGVGTLFTMTDPVASLADGFGYKHAKMPAMSASQVVPAWNPVKECGFQGPKMDAYFWAHGHTIYPQVLRLHLDAKKGAQAELESERALLGKRITKEQVATTVVMAEFTKRNYLKTQQIFQSDPYEKEEKWFLTGRACAAKSQGAGKGFLGLEPDATAAFENTIDGFFPNCKDHVVLMQNDATLECALAFEGSDDFLDWMSNLNLISHEFCGFGQVHSGFRAKMLRMVGGVDFNQVIRKRLSKCSKVTVTGHSLGGAQAELFAACANQRLHPFTPAPGLAEGYAEHRLVKWEKETPELMKGFYEDQAVGVFLRNRGTGLCMDVKGTTTVNYMSHVIMFPCELPGFQEDQQWEVTAAGFIVNKKSGKCVDGDLSRASGKALTQWTCEYNLANTSQTWRFTEYGLIQNLRNGMCINNMLQLFTCPFTDQKWEWVGDGMLKNQLTQSCVSLKGGRTGLGTPLVVMPCTEAVAGTPEAEVQQWVLAESGALMNPKSGLCVQILNKPAGETKPDMVLGLCDEGFAWTWALGSNGFMYNTKLGTCLGLAGQPGTNGSEVIAGPCEDVAMPHEVSGVWERMPNGFIKNVGHDSRKGEFQCMEVLDNKQPGVMQDGAELSMQMCKVNTDQKWEITPDGFVKQVIGGQKCLDFRGTAPPKDQLLWIDNCYEFESMYMFLDYKWIIAQDRKLIRSDLYGGCMDAKGQKSEHLEIHRCVHDDPAALELQNFEFSGDGTIVHIQSSMCLIVDTSPSTDSRPNVILVECDPSWGVQQQWELLPVTANVHNRQPGETHGYLKHKGTGRCAGTRRIAGRLEAEVVVGECPNPGTQQWQVLPNGLIQNKVKGTCMDAANNTGVAASPWELVTRTCDPSLATQQWDQVSAA